MHAPLQQLCDAAPDTALLACGNEYAFLAYSDDIHLEGKPGPVASQPLWGSQSSEAIGLRVQPRTCAVTCEQREDAAAVTASLNVTHSPTGITACGTPMGTDT